METLMHSPKKVYLLIALVLFSTLIAQVWASSNLTAVFRGGGVTIDLTYPEEAHPAEISHNLTITTNTNVEVQNITLFIYAPVNSTWEYINKSTIILPPLPANQSLPFVIWFTLPQNANGTLYCLLHVQTDQAASYLSYIFYTTHISELTFSEMLANYTSLQSKYETLLNDYNGLSADYNSSVANYNSLLSQHTELQTKYDSQVAAYNSMLSSNDQLSQEYNNLNANYKAKLTELSTSQSDYQTLNTTKNNLQTNYTTLQNVYNTLNQTYNNLQTQLNNLRTQINNEANEITISRTFMFIALMAVAGLVALIVYLKRKKPEPYMVIRKETVTVPQDEENPPP